MWYFESENVKSDCYEDEKALDMLHDALENDNLDTEDADNLVDAISTLDANVYNLCKAMIYQNFMLMRKVDSLSDMVSELKAKMED